MAQQSPPPAPRDRRSARPIRQTTTSRTARTRPALWSNALGSRRLRPTERRLLHDELDGAAPLSPVAICQLAARDHHRADMTRRKMVVAVSPPWMVVFRSSLMSVIITFMFEPRSCRWPCQGGPPDHHSRGTILASSLASTGCLPPPSRHHCSAAPHPVTEEQRRSRPHDRDQPGAGSRAPPLAAMPSPDT